MLLLHNTNRIVCNLNFNSYLTGPPLSVLGLSLSLHFQSSIGFRVRRLYTSILSLKMSINISEIVLQPLCSFHWWVRIQIGLKSWPSGYRDLQGVKVRLDLVTSPIFCHKFLFRMSGSYLWPLINTNSLISVPAWTISLTSVFPSALVTYDPRTTLKPRPLSPPSVTFLFRGSLSRHSFHLGSLFWT